MKRFGCVALAVRRFRAVGLVRVLVAVAALAALTFAAPPRAAQASSADLEFKECANDEGFGECQHFLRNPAGVTDDPCWCDKCRNGGAGQRHDGHTIPAGWNAQLFETGGLDAYLKRHSVVWGITCSECLKNDKPWPDGGGTNPGTVPATDYAGKPARETAAARLKKESGLFKKPEDVIVAWNRPGAGETNYYDALKVALDIGAEPDTNADLEATPDTITFLTDGVPTKGDIVDGDTLLEWYSGLNRYARVKTHTITFGNIGVDMPLLRQLAERNGGRFMLVPELAPGGK